MRQATTILTASRWVIALVFLSIGSLGAWAHYAELEKIARAQGQVIATARTQVIQSANDGVLQAVRVKEGDRVKKGQILAQLDRRQAAAAWQDSLGKVAALKAALIRLQAEVFDRPLVFPPEVLAHPAFVANQRELFVRRQQALTAELSALQESQRLVAEELLINQGLLATGDIGKLEVIRLQKQLADINGQISNRRNKYFQDAQADMTKAEEDLATQSQALAERRTIYERCDITAPADGLVRNIEITTPGAKVKPGDIIMELLPTNSALIVEARLKPVDVAYVRQGLKTAIKLDAFDYSIYGVLQGQVAYISPDALMEKTPAGEQVYYRVQIQIDTEALAKRNRANPGKPVVIQPGMTATLEISTGRQSVLAYLTKPITKTLSEALTER